MLVFGAIAATSAASVINTPALAGSNPSWFSRGHFGDKVKDFSDADLKLFPVEQAAPIALAEARAALEDDASPVREITFALFSESDLGVYSAALRRPWDQAHGAHGATRPG